MNPLRGAAAILVAALTVSLPAASGAPRHEAAVGDPTSAHNPRFAGRLWVEPGPESRAGGQLDITPSSPGTPPAFPFPVPGGPAPGDPSSTHLPTVEAPDTAEVHLPDLVPLPAWGVHVDVEIVTVTADEVVLARAEGRDPFASSPALRFATTIVNRGRHSLEIVGVPRPTGRPDEPVRVEASQCVRFAGPRVEGSGRVCQAMEPVGSLSFHPQHGHFHIDGFARYELRRDDNGRPGAVAAQSSKVGFCLGDTDWHGPHYDVALDTGWYRECRHTTPHVPVTMRQGISPQWGDTYGNELPGQHIPLSGVPDGVYWLAITVNPPDLSGDVAIRETNHANNTSYQRVRIYHEGKSRHARAF